MALKIDPPGLLGAPVYVPYTTLVSALDSLHRDGIPGTGRIDKTLWDSQSGAVQGQLILGFRFLGLIDDKNHVLDSLPPLVDATGEERKALLKKIIEQKYARLLGMDLTTITQGQLDEAMRSFGISGSTLLRAVRFFVKACVELGIPISKRVSEKVRSGTAGAPRKRRNNIRSADNDSNHHESSERGTWEEKLLEKFPQFDPAWPEELKTKWFEGFGKLMSAKPSQ